MRDYKKAKQFYKEYSDYIRINNCSPDYNLLDKYKECGYNITEDLIKDDEYYCFKESQPIIIKDTEDYKLDDLIKEALQREEDTIIFKRIKELTAYINNDTSEEQLKVLESLNLENYNTTGGVIILDQYSFTLFFISKDERFTQQLFMRKFVDYLNKKLNINAYIDGNDLLLDGKKFTGTSNNWVGNRFVYGMNISLSDNIDLINKLCLKKRIKEPTYLTGITKEEIEEEVISWFK